MAPLLNQVTQNRLCLSEQTYPGLLEAGPAHVIRLQPGGAVIIAQ